MRFKPVFMAKVGKEGELRFADDVSFKAHLWKFRPTDNLAVTVERIRAKRSIDQNRWYWGAVLPVISNVTGHTVNELHEIFKRRHLPKRMVSFKGVEYPLPGSTTMTDKPEFWEYIERIRADVAEFGIIIPEPRRKEKK